MRIQTFANSAPGAPVFQVSVSGRRGTRIFTVRRRRVVRTRNSLRTRRPMAMLWLGSRFYLITF